MPNIPAEMVGREQIRTEGERLQAQWDFFVQTTHPGTIQLDGDTATGRAYIHELAVDAAAVREQFPHGDSVIC
jgi:hypothetical protein